MWPRREPDVETKTPEQLALMREAGLDGGQDQLSDT
jgi:hypothetical protein